VNENIYYLRTYGLGANRNIIIIGKRYSRSIAFMKRLPEN